MEFGNNLRANTWIRKLATECLLKIDTMISSSYHWLLLYQSLDIGYNNIITKRGKKYWAKLKHNHSGITATAIIQGCTNQKIPQILWKSPLFKPKCSYGQETKTSEFKHIIWTLNLTKAKSISEEQTKEGGRNTWI